MSDINQIQWIRSLPWSSMITTRFPHGLTPDECNNLLIRDVLRPIGKRLKDPIAAYSVIVTQSPDHKPHAHSLVFTRHHLPFLEEDEPNKFRPIRVIRDYLDKCKGTILDHKDAITFKSYLYAIHPGYLRVDLNYNGGLTYIYGAKIIKEQEPIQ